MHKKMTALKLISLSTVAMAITACSGTAVKQDSSTAKSSGKMGAIKPKKASTFPDTVKDPQIGEIIVKCAGIAQKGKNHCGANGHACNGLSADNPNIKDFDKNEWIYVRKEVCDATPGRIVGKKIVSEG